MTISMRAAFALISATILTIGILFSCDSTQKRHLENDLNENPEAYKKKWGIKDD